MVERFWFKERVPVVMIVAPLMLLVPFLPRVVGFQFHPCIHYSQSPQVSSFLFRSSPPRVKSRSNENPTRTAPITSLKSTSSSPVSVSLLWMVSSGFSFDDGDQLLVSVQKPLGIVLEQDNDDDNDSDMAPVVVAQVDPNGSAGRAGVQVGDVLVAVQNAGVEQQSLEYVMDRIGQAPRVVNLRFMRLLGR